MHQDDLSVLVFKEDRAPRSFLIPLSWFSRMGVILAALLLFSAVTTVIALQNYLALRNARREFTREIEDEKRLAHAPEVPQPTTQPTAQTAVKEVAPMPAPSGIAGTQQTTTTETAATPPDSGPLIGPLFSVFGRGVVSGFEDPATVPVALKNPHTSWSGRTLTAKFEIHYVHDDGGNQQGRIFVLARGPNTIMAYPKGAFEPVGSPALLGIKNGEHFSVSRLRGVEAGFENIQKSEVVSLEAFIIGDDGKLLIHEALPTQ